MATKSRKQQLEEMLELDPKDVFLRYALAKEYQGEGNDAKAVQLFEELWKDSPDYVPAYFQCGQVLVRLDRVAEARQVLQQGLAAARRTNDAHAAGEIQELLLSLG